MKKIRIDRLLANLGYGSRKDVAAAVKAGAFALNDEIITDAARQIPYDPAVLSAATYDGEELDPVFPLSLLLHKPPLYTCSHDEQGLLVYDLLPPRWQRRSPALSTAGRLDKDSTGLVLITDDGDLLHRVISPKLHVWKQYYVTLRDPLKGDEAGVFGSGEFMFENDRVPLKPAKWIPDSDRSGFMSLQEGRYRQIRRMFGARGNHVETLHRLSIGGLQIGNLLPGEYHILDSNDLDVLFSQTAES
jgi:16S rRNA pseudouridine516 synthase